MNYELPVSLYRCVRCPFQIYCLLYADRRGYANPLVYLVISEPYLLVILQNIENNGNL